MSAIFRNSILNSKIRNVITVPNYTEAYERLEFRQQIKLLFIAEFPFDPVKGLILLLQALDSVAEKIPISLTVIGKVSKREILRYKSKITFLGRMENSQVLETMRNYDCLVVPSLEENSPNVIREAMNVNLPILASSVGGIPELLKNSKISYLFEPNENALSQAILDFHKNPPIFRVNKNRFQTEIVDEVEKHIKHYEKIVQLYGK